MPTRGSGTAGAGLPLSRRTDLPDDGAPFFCQRHYRRIAAGDNQIQPPEQGGRRRAQTYFLEINLGTAGVEEFCCLVDQDGVGRQPVQPPFQRADEIHRSADQDRRQAYCHSGRFDVSALRYLDSRRHAKAGDQFNYRLTNAGQVKRNCPEVVGAAEFQSLLDEIEEHLRRMGREIYSGRAEVAPYRKGLETACDQCVYQAICRFDPWAHQFRLLRPAAKPGNAPTAADETDDGQADDEEARQLT